MTAPTTAVVLCSCGHGRPRHDGELAPQCSAPSCTCLRFRPDMAVARPTGTDADTHSVVPIQDVSASRSALPRCTVCSHGKKRHEVAGFAPACVVGDCACQRYNDKATAPQTSKQAEHAASPPVTPTPEAIRALVGPEQAPDAPTFTEPPAEDAPADVDLAELLRRGHESDLKPIVKLAGRIDALVDDLRERLADEAAAAGVKNLISDLEQQQLADAKAQLRGVATGRRTTTGAEPLDGPFACPDCPKTFTSAQGVTMHRTRSHGYRKAAS